MSDNNNIQPVCAEHAPKPMGLTTEDVDPYALIDCYVKLCFVTEDGRAAREHLWVLVHHVNPSDSRKLAGEINSDPVVVNRKRGDRLEFYLDEIEQIQTAPGVPFSL